MTAFIAFVVIVLSSSGWILLFKEKPGWVNEEYSQIISWGGYFGIIIFWTIVFAKIGWFE